MYKVGAELMEIHNDVLTNLQLWDAEKQVHDTAFALAVMLSLTSPENVLNGIINQDAMDFTIGKNICSYYIN